MAKRKKWPTPEQLAAMALGERCFVMWDMQRHALTRLRYARTFAENNLADLDRCLSNGQLSREKYDPMAADCRDQLRQASELMERLEEEARRN
jgi:hypothetical protein